MTPYESVLSGSEVQYQSVVDNLKQVIFQTDARGRFTFLNAAWTEITGFDVAESLGSSFLRYVHPDDRQAHAELVQPLIASTTDCAGQVARYLTRAGGVRWVEVFVQVAQGPEGAVTGMFGTLTDITDRRRAEEELHATRARLQHLLDSTPAVIYSSRTAGDYALTFVSENVSHRLGYRTQEALEDPAFWTARLHPEDAPAVLAAVAAMREGTAGEAHQSLQYRFRHRDGGYRWIHDERRLVRDDAGEAVEFVGSWVDITESRRIEDELRQAQKMEIAGRLAGGVAHDFNNLLTVITGRTHLLLADLGAEDPRRRDLELIQETAQRAAALTRQLLVFSRKQVLAPRVLDLNAVLANMEKMLRRLIGEDIDLVLAAAPELGRVRADSGQIEQVIMNLAVNARDVMPQGGRLGLTTANVELDEPAARRHVGARPGPYVMLAVSDTGCGIDAETQAHIFEPFFTTKGPDKGTGLGLSTVYGIVQQSEGLIMVDSEPGEGTTFRVYLPRVDEAAGAVEASAPRRTLPRGTETILLVEDDAEVRALAREILRTSGYTVMEARHGEEALERAAAHSGPIHLLLTDVVMPRMSGAALVERLVAVRQETRVLYMSGYTDDMIVHHRVAAAETALVEKPFTPAVLAAKVREVLDAPRASA